MTTTKFKLKWGNIEVEFEGSQEYIEKKYFEIMDKIDSLKNSLQAPTALNAVEPILIYESLLCS